MSCCGVCGGQEADSKKEQAKDKEQTREQVQIPVQVVQMEEPNQKPTDELKQ